MAVAPVAAGEAPAPVELEFGAVVELELATAAVEPIEDVELLLPHAASASETTSAVGQPSFGIITANRSGSALAARRVDAVTTVAPEFAPVGARAWLSPGIGSAWVCAVHISSGRVPDMRRQQTMPLAIVVGM
jgi:hypothetical protein